MYAVFVAIFCLSLTEVSYASQVPAYPAYVTPVEGFTDGTAVGQTNGQHFHEHEATPNSHQKQGIAAENSPPSPSVGYGLPPPDGQSFKGTYQQGQQYSDLQNSDELLKFNMIQGSSNSDQLRSFPHELSNEELIESFVPPVLPRNHPDDQDSGLEYAHYAPGHHEEYSAGITRSESPSHPSQPHREGYGTQTNQNQPKISEHSSNLYHPSKSEIFTSDDNRRVPNHSQEVTVGSAPESEGSPYQSYRYSQDVQRPETEMEFQNPPSPNLNYEVPPVLANVQGSQTEAKFQYPEYEAPPVVSDVHHSQTMVSFQNPSYPNPIYEAGAAVANDHRSQILSSFKNLSYTSPGLDVPAVAFDEQRSQTEKTFQHPNYEVLPEVSDVQRSKIGESFQNPSYPGRIYKTQSVESSDVHHSQTGESYQNPNYEAQPGVSDVQRSKSVKSFQNPSYPKSQYGSPPVLPDVPQYDAPSVLSDVQRSRTGESAQNPSYPNPQYEAPPRISDVQRSKSVKSFQNPSYPKSQYEAPPVLSDVPQYDAPSVLSDVKRSQTRESVQNPSYPNLNYGTPPQISDVQLSKSLKSFQNPSYPKSQYESPPVLPDVTQYDAPSVLSYVHRSQTGEAAQNPSYPNPQYEAPPGFSDFQRSKPVTSYQNPSYSNLKYPSLGSQLSHTERKPPNRPFPAYGLPRVESQYVKTSTPSHQDFISNYDNGKVYVPGITLPAVHPQDVPYYHKSNGRNSAIYDHKVPQVGQTFDYPAAAESNFKSSNASPFPTPGPQNQKHGSAPHTSYETSPYQSREAPERYGTQSYRYPSAKYSLPLRYIAIFQNHRAPGKPDISAASYLTQPLHNQPQTLLGQPAGSSNQKAGVPIALPISPYYYRDSPTGSISSTFISKDVGGYTQPFVGSGDRNASPQTVYGLPNF